MPLTPFDPLRRNVADTPEAEDAPLGILGIAADGNLVRVPDVRGEAGQGVPTGGTTGQVLAKTSSTNYATEWITLPASSAATWGAITGSISAQTDLAAALAAKQDAGSYAAAVHAHVIGDVTGLQAALDGKQDAGSYATAAQGELADSAVQPGFLATVATTGAYGDLSGLPILGTAAAAATEDFAAAAHTHTIANVTGLQAALDGKQAAGSYATAAQGALADSAVQPGDIGTAAAADTGDFAAAAHTHSIANVTGLQAALDAKQATLVSATNIKTVNGESLLGAGNLVIAGEGGSGVWGAITGTLADQTDLVSALAAKQDTGSYATGAQGALADSAVQPGDLATVATSGAYGDLSGLPTLGTAAAAATGDFAPAVHTHSIANVTGLQTALDGKQAAGSYATGAQGALADSAVQPADLADVATSGAYSDLTGLPTLGTAAAAATGDFAAAAHTHAIGDVTGLQTALDGKAATSHTQAISTITGLQTALDGKAATSHTHSIANVTGLQAALDGKQAAGSYATAAQGALADSAVQPGDLATVATSGAYSDLSGLPTLGAAITVSATAPASPSVNDLWLDIS